MKLKRDGETQRLAAGELLKLLLPFLPAETEQNLNHGRETGQAALTVLNSIKPLTAAEATAAQTAAQFQNDEADEIKVLALATTSRIAWLHRRIEAIESLAKNIDGKEHGHLVLLSAVNDPVEMKRLAMRAATAELCKQRDEVIDQMVAATEALKTMPLPESKAGIEALRVTACELVTNAVAVMEQHITPLIPANAGEMTEQARTLTVLLKQAATVGLGD